MNLENNLRGIKTLAYSSVTWRRNKAAPDTVRRRCRGDGVIRRRHILMPKTLQGNYQSGAGTNVGTVQGGGSHCLHTLLAQTFS
ncbi:hypothetical protein AAE485_13165 [Acidithiobacillus ferriphilus]|jgi:hypothetical protein|uniref:hypothetical protein n=1 Tax=Acidithiobacillus ferriphilus TaxID=1689834 RepID=UPI00390C9023